MSKQRKYIKWTTPVVSKISNETWLLPTPAERVSSAKADLAGTLSQDELSSLSESKLNHAFSQLPKEQQESLLQQRRAGSKSARGRGMVRARLECVRAAHAGQQEARGVFFPLPAHERLSGREQQACRGAHLA